MKRFFPLLAGALLAAGISAPAQAGQVQLGSESLKAHNLGPAAGLVSGYGLSYRRWFASGNGFQITGIPILNVDDRGILVNTSLGAMGLRQVHQSRRTNFFLYAGGHYIFTWDRDEFNGESTSLANVLALGGGGGIEVHLPWNLNFTLMGGYAALGAISEEYGSNVNDTDRELRWALVPTPEVGLYYAF